MSIIKHQTRQRWSLYYQETTKMNFKQMIPVHSTDPQPVQHLTFVDVVQFHQNEKGNAYFKA